MPLSLKVRIPKSGAYLPEVDNKESKDAIKEETSVKNTAASKDSKGNKKPSKGKKGASNSGKSGSSRGGKGKKQKDAGPDQSSAPPPTMNIKSESDSTVSPVKEVPQCLKFKLSNGKMVR